MEKILCPACRRSNERSRKKIPELRRLPKIPTLSNPGNNLNGRVFWGCDVCGNVCELKDLQIARHQQTPLDRYYEVYQVEKAKIIRFRQIIDRLNKTGEPPPLIDSYENYFKPRRRTRKKEKKK